MTLSQSRLDRQATKGSKPEDHATHARYPFLYAALLTDPVRQCERFFCAPAGAWVGFFNL